MSNPRGWRDTGEISGIGGSVAGTQASAPAGNPTRRAPEIVLQPFTQEHYAELTSWIRSPEEHLLFCGQASGWPLTPELLDANADMPGLRAWRAVLAAEPRTGVGHIEFVRTAEQRGRMARVLVQPRFRGFGIAKPLVRACLAEARAVGIHTIDLNVMIGNELAIHTYRGLGFRELGVNPERPSMLQMRQDLD